MKIFNPNTGELNDFKLPKAVVPPGWVRLDSQDAVETVASLVELRDCLDRLAAVVDLLILDIGSDR